MSNAFDQTDDWEDVQPAAVEPAPAAAPAPQVAAAGDDWEDVSPQWRGYPTVAATSAARSAVTGVGTMIAGVPEVVGNTYQHQLDVFDRIDRGERTGMAEDVMGYGQMNAEGRARLREQMSEKAAAYKPEESALAKAGTHIEEFGKEKFPLSPEEEKSITAQAAGLVGGMVPMVAAGAISPPLGMAVGVGQMGLQGAREQAQSARQKGATPEVVEEAARAGFGANAALGVVPVHAVLRPVERYAPGIVDWARARLARATQSGLTFATIGEAQHWLAQQIAEHHYDPDAKYSFDIDRAISGLIGGGFLGALPGTPYRGARPPAEAAAAAPGEHAKALGDILGERPSETTVDINGQRATATTGPENASILGGERLQTDRQELQSLVDANAPIDDLISHPVVQRAMEENRAAVPTGTLEELQNPEWRAGRVYNFGGEEVHGWDAAVDRLTEGARAFSDEAPVEQNRHAVFVLGPPASGKSHISEGLARAMRAAIVDSDEAKQVIPEYRNGLGTGAVHEESSLLAKDVLYKLGSDGNNLIIPKIGADTASTRRQIESLKSAGYTVDVVHVAATPEISNRRNISRFLRTGRLVDPEYIAEVGDNPRRTSYLLRGDVNDFLDVDTSKTGHYQIREGAGPLADIVRARGDAGLRPHRGAGATGEGISGAQGQALLGEPVPAIRPHRVTAADGTAIDVAPVVVEANSLKTSQDRGYDAAMQPRQRDRAASQAQVRDIATNLDPERLGYSAEADRGAPIVGPDGMVESGNGRVMALRNVYEQGGKRADAYRAWLTRQGVDISGFRNPVLVRQRTTPLQPAERQAFSLAANQAATLSFSAPERALADAHLIDDRTLGLLRNPDDIGAAANRDFVRRFVASLPQGEQGAMADARGALSAEGLTRVRNAILAKAYGDADLLARISESTSDDIRSISNALVAVAPHWARLSSAIQEGRIRPGIDATAELLEAVKRTADLRARGDNLGTFLAQTDAFDTPTSTVDWFMRSFYNPKGQRMASAKEIANSLRYYAQEASKVTADDGLGLGLVPVDPRDILRLGERERERYGARDEIPERQGVGNGEDYAPGSGGARGPVPGSGGEGPAPGRPFSDQTGATRAQRPESAEGRRQRLDELERIINDRGYISEDFHVVRRRDGRADWITRDDNGEIRSTPLNMADAADRIARLEFHWRGELPRPEVYDRATYDALRARAQSEVTVPRFPDMRLVVEPRGNGAPHRVRAFLGDKQVGVLSLALEKIPVQEDRRGNRPDSFVPAGFVDAVSVEPEYRRKGVGNALYRAAEMAMGDELTPSRELFPDARGFWESYRPGAMENIDLKSLFSEDVRAQRADIEDLFPTETVPLSGGKKGEQHTIPQTERISGAELARRRAAEPMRPRVEQRPMESGLFGDEHLQGTLKIPTEEPTLEAGALEHGPGPESGPVRGTAPKIPGREQPRRAPRPAQIRRPEQLSLFGGEPGERPVPRPDGGVREQQGRPEAPAPAEGPSVTKPPARGGGNRAPRHRLSTPARGGLREAELKIAERSRSNYRITADDRIGEGAPRQKVRDNLEAIRILKTIEEEGRLATPGEKAILARYTGWGAFAQDMFAPRRTEWQTEREALRTLLNDEEYNAAKASTLNAHFTSPAVISGIWKALGHLGFKGGNAIEPAAGIGHFIGMIPDKMAPKTAWTAVELDTISGRITKALYGGADVNVHGFETLKRPSNYYDLAVSNVPFGNFNLTEKPYGSFPIHDFFFVKSLDKVRPGGVVSFITSRYTMDRMDAGTRRLLANTADLVGAIRLPGGNKGAFAANAGTEVTTDILFLRKKVPGEKPFPGANWLETKEVQTPDGPVNINEYFADRPEMMLGEMRLQGSMYRANEPVLVGDTANIDGRIAEAAARMPADAMLPRDTPPPTPITADEIGTNVKDGAFFTKDGQLYQRIEGQGVPRALPADQHERIVGLMGMRDLYNDLLGMQLRETPLIERGLVREKLRDAYDAFVKKYGPINKEERTVTSRVNKAGEPVVITRLPNISRFMEDPDAWKVASIENYNAETGKATRADIQNKDVIAPPMEREINGPSDALAASLNDTGRVDIDHIAELLNLNSPDDVVRTLGDLVYQNPDGRSWETADGYLSGNVVQKLEDARAIAADDPSFLRNVAALEKVQPQPLTSVDIVAQFGAPWIPTDVYEGFMKDVLGASNPRVARVPVTGEWRMKIDGVSREARAKFGTDRVDVEQIARAALNNQQITVHDRLPDDTSVVNDKATTDARVKTELLKEAFTGDPDHGVDGWIFSDPERSQRLEAIYNRTYNNLVPRKFDGTHLTLPGLNPNFSTRQHRKDAVWRILQSGNTLLAHVVGSGKTVSMIAAGMEQKRLGLINKPAYVVPNHMLEQFSREFIQAYPDAKILVAQKDEMTRDNRRAFLAKVASNNWDGVVITHDAFGRINMGQDFRRKFIQEQLDELSRALAAEEREGGKKSLTVKNLERAKKKMQERLNKLMAEERKDPGTNFEESGIDFLMVDEAHKFKNLNFVTRLGRVKGLAQGDSQRAEDLFLKLRYLEQNRPGRSGVFATGTPVSNTMAELWTMQRYLQLDKLRERGLENFDAWANTFGRTVNNMELSADGRTFKEVSSFSKFVNVPELISLYSEVADTKTADMLNLPRPEVKTRRGAPGIEIVEATPSAAEEAHIQKLVELAESLKGKRPKKGEPNMLSVVTQGRKVATDGRLIGEDFDFNPQGKIALAVNNIYRIWKEGKEPGMGQMVFLDMGVPQPKGGRRKAAPTETGIEGEGIDPAQAETQRINLYADLKKRLVDQGIPAKEIAFIHDATDDAKKARLFSDVRSGKVRVIMGSSEKMGVGTNAQDRLIAMHHLDAPWKPAEVEQRDGRIVRQGNLNDNVQIYRYVTKRSFDAFMWQKLDTKARFIGQVLSGAKGSRHAEDIDNPLPEAAEMKAAASGDPRILEQAELDRQVRTLTAQKRSFESTKQRAGWEVGTARDRIKQYEDALPTARADAALFTDLSGDKFVVELGGTPVTNRQEAGKAILDRLLALEPNTFYAPKVVNIGKISGLEMGIKLQTGWAGQTEGTILRATPLLRGKSAYEASTDTVINPQTDPAGLIRRFENILGNIRQNPDRLDGELTRERDNLKRLEKTLAEPWSKEKDYRDALKKLDDLTTSMKAPQHPDVATVKAQALTPEERSALFEYGRGLIGDVIKSVRLIGSQARMEPSARDTDILYDIGKRDLPKDSVEAADRIREIIESGPPIDLDRFDTFVKSGDRHFHLQEGAGREFVENTEYAKENAGKPSIELANAKAQRAVALAPDIKAYVEPTERYTANENEIAKAVQEIGARMAPQANVQGASALRLEGHKIWGAFINSEQFPHLIAWSLERGTARGIAGAVRHEIIHHLKEAGMFRPEEWKALEKAAVDQNWLAKHDIENRYPDLSRNIQIEEAIAEQFSKWRTERSIEKPGLIRDAFQRLDLFMRRVAAAARRFLGKDATANDVFTGIETGEIGRRPSAQIEAQKRYYERQAAAKAQTPGGEARERREQARAAAPARTVFGKISEASDNLRARAADLAKKFHVDEFVRDMQIRVAPMAARDAPVWGRALTKEFMNAKRQSRENWNRADKYITEHFDPAARKRMWDAADEQSVAMQQGRPTQGIGLDRLSTPEREVVETLQRHAQNAFNEAVSLDMVEGPGLPSYAPRMVVRMSEGHYEHGPGQGAEVVRDVRTLALATARLEDAIAGRRMINVIEDIGRRSGNATVNVGGAPSRRSSPEGMVSHVLDQLGKNVSTTTPQLKHRKHLTREETEAAAGRISTPPENAPHWFTLSHPAFQRWEPRLILNEQTGKREAARDQNGQIIFDRKPIYVRGDLEGPLRGVLSRDTDRFYRGLMALKGKAMSVIMMSPLIHNQVEWGRALPAAPGKVVTGQIYFEGNRVTKDPAKMREAIAGGTVPIGSHGFMQDILSIAEAPTVRPGRSWTAKGLGAGAQVLGHVTRIYDPRAGADAVRRSVDWMGDVWHNTFLWDRIRDLQMGLWSHLRQHLVDKGYDPYTANVAASHFANRYAGALPIEAMSGVARGLANVLLFSRTFTLGNIGAYKDAITGLPRDAQALIQEKVGWDELQKVQSFVKRKSRAMLALDAGLFYTTLSALQSAFNVAGVGHTVGTLGGMIAGGALGGRGGKYGRLAAAIGGGAVGFELASMLGAGPGTRDLEDELSRYWDRFKGLLERIHENPLETIGNPFKMIESLGATAENEPGLQSRLLIGYQPDGTAIYARLPAGKVTEELIGYLTEPNEMIHRKLSTFAKPLNQIWTNDVGFGRKLYNPKADTPAEVGKNIAKIAGAIVFSQIPTETILGVRDWYKGGPGSETAGLKAIAPLTGFSVRKGYPGGPELGELAAVEEKQRYKIQEALPGIRDKIRQGDTEGAIAKMQELNVPQTLQNYYIRTTISPESRMSSRKVRDFYLTATPEERKRLERQMLDKIQGRAAGGRVNAAETRKESHYSATGGKPDRHCGEDRDWQTGWCKHFRDPHGCTEVGGHIATKGVCDWYKWVGYPQERADGGRVAVGPESEHLQDRRGESERDVLARLGSEAAYPPNQITGDRTSAIAREAGIDDIERIPGRRDPINEILARAAGGRVVAENINHDPTPAQAAAGNYAKDIIHLHGLRIAIENAKGSTRRGVGKDGKPWTCVLPAHYGEIGQTEGADGDKVDAYIGQHPKSTKVFVVDQVDADSKKFDEHKSFISFANERQVRATYAKAFSDGRGKDRLGHLTEMSIAQFRKWLEHGDTTEQMKPRRRPLKPINKVDRGHDVPYLAGPSNDGGTIYIDQQVPRTIVVKGRKLDPSIPLRIHENTEQKLMIGRGMSYEDAHKQATAAEREWIESHGYDWQHYEAVMDGLLSSVEHEHPKDPPADLFLKPYPHDKARLLRKNAEP